MERIISAPHPAVDASSRFRPPRVSRGVWWATIWLTLYVPALFATVNLMAVVVNTDEGSAPLPSEVTEATSAYGVIVCFGLVVQVLAIAVWQVRSYGNLRSLLGQRPSPGVWLLGLAWLVPLVNIVVSTRVFRDLWRGSAREATSNRQWRTLAVPRTLGRWWLIYCAAILGAFAVVDLVRPEEVGHVSAGHWLAYATLMVLVLTARAGRRIMVTIDDRHWRRAGELGLAPVDPADEPPEGFESLDAACVGLSALLEFAGDGDGIDFDFDGGDDGD